MPTKERIELNNDIVDHIMDNVIEMCANKAKILSAVALYGSHWRHRVNQHRFRQIIVGKKDEKLEAVLSTSVWDLWRSDEGVIQHVRSVCLLVNQDTDETRRDKLTNILHILFIRDRRPFPTEAPISLIIDRRLFGSFSRPNMPAHIDFKKIDHNLAETLHKVMCSTSSRINSLSLKNIINVPHQLSASIQHLTLHCTVEFARSEKYAIEFPHLKTLSVIGYPHFSPWLAWCNWNAPSLSHVNFYDVRASDANKIMARLGSQVTSLEFSGSISDLFNDIFESDIERLVVNYSAESCSSMKSDTPEVTVFDNIANVLPRCLPSNVILNVNLDVSNSVQSDIEGFLEEIYEGLYSAALIDLLEEERRPETQVKLNICISNSFGWGLHIEDNATEIMKGLHSLFSDLDRIPGLELIIKIEERRYSWRY